MASSVHTSVIVSTNDFLISVNSSMRGKSTREALTSKAYTPLLLA